MPTGVIFNSPKVQFLSSAGAPLANGTVTTYLAGTTTLETTYQDQALSVANTNPINLDSRGEATVWLDGAKSYKILLKNAGGVEQYTVDNIQGGGALADRLRTDLADTASNTKGAALVSFSHARSYAAGSIGAKLKKSICVTDAPYNAVGDGIADDTAAVTSALATGREIYFPAGTYNITPITVTGTLSMKITGAGRDVTKIVQTSTGTALTFSNCQWLQISDLSIQPTGTAQTLANASGILLSGGSGNALIERVNFYGFSLDGLRMVGTAGTQLSGNIVRNCYFLGSGRYQLYSEYNNDWTIDDNQFGKLSGITHAQIGAYLNESDAGTYTKNKHWENAIGLKALNSHFNSYVDNRIEINDDQGAYFDGCTDITFNSNRVYSNSATTDGADDNVYLINCDRMTFVGNNIFTWDASFSRWGVNFDTGCSDVVLGKNTIRGFDTTNFGPIRLVGGLDDVSGDLVLSGTATAVAAGSTIYMSDGAATAEAAAYVPLNRKYAVARIYTATEVAPGAGQTFTYTIRKNGVDTAMVATSTGAASFSAAANSPAPQILFSTGDFISLKLVTSAGAAVVNHRFYIVLVEH